MLLLLAPAVLRTLIALRALAATSETRVDAGLAIAALIVWAGVLYLVYLGFPLIRWTLGLIVTIALVLNVTTLVRFPPPPGWLLFSVLMNLSALIGCAVVLASRPAHRFFRYQRGQEHGLTPRSRLAA